MKILGIDLKKPDGNDIFIVSVLFLASILVSVGLAETIGAKPETVLAWAFAGGSGALLSAIGIKVRDGSKQIILICVASILAALIGHIFGLFLTGIL